MARLTSLLSIRSVLRFTFAILVASASLGTMPGGAAADCGDVNQDDAVTAVDALAILRSAVGIGDLCHANCECDVNFDREIGTIDALLTLRAAVRNDLDLECGFQDECFDDEDCEQGFHCGTDPSWECDAACLPSTATSTTELIIDECFDDSDCEGNSAGERCCAYECAECSQNTHCPEGQYCSSGCACLPLP